MPTHYSRWRNHMAEVDVVAERFLIGLSQLIPATGPEALPTDDRKPVKEIGGNILDDVHTFLSRFVSYPSEHAHVAHTLWVVHTHLMTEWESTPRIAFLSPEPGSGKTRALEVTETMVPRPVEAVNVSPAYLFRRIKDAEGLPTLL